MAAIIRALKFHEKAVSVIMMHRARLKGFGQVDSAAGKLRQKWYATAVTKFTNPSQSLLAEPCFVEASYDLMSLTCYAVLS